MALFLIIVWVHGISIKLEVPWAVILYSYLLHDGLSLAIVIVYADGWLFDVIIATENRKSLGIILA